MSFTVLLNYNYYLFIALFVISANNYVLKCDFIECGLTFGLKSMCNFAHCVQILRTPFIYTVYVL